METEKDFDDRVIPPLFRPSCLPAFHCNLPSIKVREKKPHLRDGCKEEERKEGNSFFAHVVASCVSTKNTTSILPKMFLKEEKA